MALAARAKLDQMERLARVELEHVADAIGEAQGVRGLVGEARCTQPLVLGARRLEGTFVVRAEARFLDLVWDVGAEVRRQPLPLAGKQAMPLEIPEGAVVGDDLEPVGERLEPATRTV